MNCTAYTRWFISVCFSLSIISSVLGLAVWSGELFADPLRVIELPTFEFRFFVIVFSIAAFDTFLRVLLIYSRQRPFNGVLPRIPASVPVVRSLRLPRSLVLLTHGSRAPPALIA